MTCKFLLLFSGVSLCKTITSTLVVRITAIEIFYSYLWECTKMHFYTWMKAITRPTAPTTCNRCTTHIWMASKHPWLHHNDGLWDLEQLIDAWLGISYPEPSTIANDSLYRGRQHESGTHRSPGHELMSYQSSYELTPQQCTLQCTKGKRYFGATEESQRFEHTWLCKLSHIPATDGVIRPPKSDEL